METGTISKRRAQTDTYKWRMPKKALGRIEN